MSAPSIPTPPLDAVAALLVRRTGLIFPEVRRSALAGAVADAMARARARGAEELLRHFETSPDALDDLISEITVPESYFFRAPEQFELLRREVLPEVVRRRGAGHHLRLLSAGCAAGEEPYSLAIVLEEEGLARRSVLIGTDVSRASLARAAEARYGEWSLRGSAEAFRSRYFRRAGGRSRLVEPIRRRVELRHLNLAEDVYPSHATGIAAFDVIFCRNTLIYFSPEAVARVAARLFATLAEGGWLFTGASDPPLGAHAPFETVMTPAGMLYRRARTSAGVEDWTHVGEDAAPPFETASPCAERERRGVVASGGSRSEPSLEREPAGDPVEAAGATVARVRALADAGRIAEALEAASAAARLFPVSAEVLYLRAVLLAEAGRDREAADGLRRALYVDRSLAVAALALGLALRRVGEIAGAGRALRQARAILAERPPDEVVPLADGERAGRLLATVDTQIRLLEEAAT